MYSTKHKISTWKLLLALIFSGIAASSMAQDINISVSDTAAIAGETILVPLRISPIDETDAVISGTFKFSTNESIFEIVGFDKAGTLLENTSNVFYNVGTNTLAFAGTDTLVGSGTLIYLRVKAKDNATYFQYTDLSFDEATLDEGEPAVNATGARWTIKGIQINPRSSSTFVLEGDSLQFNLTGNVVDPVTWSVTDTTIGTIDSNGLFAAKTFGLVQVKAVDGQGLRDSTAFFRVQPASLTELSVTIPDTSIRQTKDIELPIYISDVTGLEVLSADLQVNYNQNYLTLNGVTSAGTMTESWGEPTINTETGSVKIASAGTDTLEGFGTLYYLNFTVKDINTGSFPINFVYANLNEDLSIDLNNGTFTVLAKPTINLNIPDTVISIGQSIDFDVTGGNGTGPYTWELDDSNIGSIDANTGELTGLSRGDVLVNAIDSEGFLSSGINVRVNDFDAYLDSSTATYPDTIEVALRTGELSLFNVLSYQAEVDFDTTKLEFVGLELTDTQSENASVEATVENNLSIASAGTSFLGGTDPLVILRFAQKDAIQHLDILELDLKYLTFDEPGPNVPTTSPLPGILDIIKIDPPETPVLVNPADLAVDQNISILFEWGASARADDYTYELASDSLFSSILKDQTLPGTQFLVDSLDYLTTYFWRVKASNLGGESSWSDTLKFTTIIEKPEIPTLVQPADAITKADTSLTFGWNASLRADAYVFQISKQSDFSTLEFSTPVFDTTYTQDGLEFLTNYYWRVKATNNGGESDFSAVQTFETKAVPAKTPGLLLPAMSEADTDTSVTLLWTSETGAISYEYQLATDAGFSAIISEANTGSDTSATVSDLEYLTQYFWRVRTIGAQDTSAYSGAFSFTTKIEKPAVPMLINPSDGEDRLSVNSTLSWNTAARADEYGLQVATDAGFTTVIVDDVTSDTSYAVTGLDHLTEYFWRVKASNTTGESAYSAVFNFETKAVDATIPGLLLPAMSEADTDTSVSLLWTSATGAISYEYQLATDAGFSAIISEANTGTDTSATVSDLDYLTQYFWRVRTVGAQDTSAYSGAFSFTTKIEKPAVPMLIDPADGEERLSVNPTLSWNTAARADEYKFQVATDAGFLNLVVDDATSDTSYIVTGLDHLTEYFWRVKASNTTGESAYSAAFNFETKAVDATIPGLLLPAMSETDTDTSVTLMWTSATGAISYEYQLATDAGFSAIISEANTGSDTSATVNDLEYLTQYFWRVRTVGAQDTSAYSGAFSFTTKIEKPELPMLVSPSDGTNKSEIDTELTWAGSLRAEEYQVQLSKNPIFDVLELDSMLADTMISITGLDYSSTYFWRVKAINTGGESAYTTIWSFETKIAPTGLPVPLLPAMSESGVDTLPMFSWTNAENAVSYRFQLSTTGDFSNVIDDQRELTDTTATASTGLMFATNYFWRVKAFGVDDSTEWSLVFNFTTRFDELAAPILLSPTKNAVDVEDSVSFAWTSVLEADSYDYELSSDTSSSAFISINQADTMYTQTGLAFDSTYYWRVRANDGINSRSSVWTPWFAFTVKSRPDAIPIVVNPLGSITLIEDFADTTISDLNTVFEDPGEVLSFAIISNTDLVTASIVGTNLNLSPVQDTSGTAEIVIEASDAAGNTVSDTLSISVTPVNDLPYVVQLPDTLTFKVGEVYGFTIDTAFADVEDELSDFSFNVSVTPADILLSFDPSSYTITLSSPTFIGFGEIVLTVEDSDGGKLEVTLVIEVEMATSNALMADIPTNFELQQNYPNPFNPSSNIRFGLPESGEVRLNVYNMLGQRVATLVNQKMQAGWHSVTFDASGLSSGTYIYRITSGDFVQTKKMMLIK